ncbi:MULTISPECIES: glycosyltransferase family 4 protein [Nostocales]|uniref:Glycosyl transferase n=3 Tax=Nostocales TaxID=1161 RepID=A0A0C1QW65_9CYAN|nr:MraY family glycosyltransferase [Tolypothrix bouteillei]KAF3884581.1 undecaprenyl/decaprenyl-phosphate alpha-N-acetylglucosaminyl 1-phosphate transferase [Tolypothrix bouteillei VB521301]
MPAQIYHLIAFLVAAVVVLWTTPDVRNFGIKSGQVDKPNERKVHQRPMVRLGGISIFAGTIASLLVIWALGGFGNLSTEKEWQILGVILGGVGFFLIGLADDLLNLSPIARLMVQIVVATGAWKAGVSIDFLSIPTGGLVQLGWLSFPVTIVWLVGMVNAINWIDGLDGLAAGVSGIASVVMLVVALFMQQPEAALITAALGGGALGFLRYNFNPAQIFMGDGGAYFMGFTLAAVSVIGLVKTAAVTAVLSPFLILAVPIIDMSAVILLRVLRGKSPFIADKSHLHHRLLRAGLSHRRTVLFIYSLTFWVGSLALVIAGIPNSIAFACGATSLLTYNSLKVRKNSEQS